MFFIGLVRNMSLLFHLRLPRIGLLVMLLCFIPTRLIAEEEQRIRGPDVSKLIESEKVGTAFKQHLTWSEDREKIDTRLDGDTEERLLTLLEAIELSLKQNPELRVQRLDPERVGTFVGEAEGKLDPRLTLVAQYEDQNRRSGSDVLGSSYKDDSRRLGSSLQKSFSSSTKVGIEYFFERRATEAASANLNPEWRNLLQVIITQPVLQGSRQGDIGSQIQYSETLYRGLRTVYEAELSQHVLTVIRAYWEQLYFRKAVDVQQRASAFADKVMVEAEAQVKVGTLAPVDASEAQFLAQLRKEELFKAVTEFEVKRTDLLKLIGFDAAEFPFKGIRVADSPSSREVQVTLRDSLKTAEGKRAEIQGYKTIIEARKMGTDFYLNRLLPRFDIVLRASTRGIAGTPTASDSDFGDLVGSRGDSFNTLFEDDDRGLFAGVELEYVFDNRTAKAQLAAERIKEAEARERLRSALHSVSTQVTEAISLFESNRDRLKSADRAIALSDSQLEAAQEKLKNGVATVRTVFEVQEDVARAELIHLSAVTDYEISLAELLFARGELLEFYRIDVR